MDQLHLENPTTTAIIAWHNGDEIKKISVYNNRGQLVYEKEANAKHYRLSTSEFNTGIYLFKIETTEKTITSKVNVVK